MYEWDAKSYQAVTPDLALDSQYADDTLNFGRSTLTS
jgi:hypothetical protein